MSFLLRKLVTRLERTLSPILGRLLYPSTGVNVLCWTDTKKNQAIVLEVDGNYHLPGGMAEQGEHPEKTAAREFKEETNLKVKINKFIGIKTRWNQIEALHLFYEGTLDDNFENNQQGWEGKPIIVDKEEISHIIEELP